MIAGYALAIIYHYVVMGAVFGCGWPLNSFLCKPEDRFGDFYCIVTVVHALVNSNPEGINMHLMTPVMPGYVWIPILLWIFDKCLALKIFILTIITFIFVYLFKSIKMIGGSIKYSILMSALVVLTSYPLLFLIDRGNFEGIQFILLTLFTYLYINEKYKTSILMLALACCMKPFAIVFLVLFLSRDKFKYIGLFVVEAAAIVWLSFGFLPGGFKYNLINLLVGLSYYDKIMVLGPKGILFNHTMYTPVYLINSILNFCNPLTLKKTYLIYALILFLGITFFIIKYETYLWRKIFLLYLCMIGLPYISANYTLVHLYVPAMLFFQYCEEEKSSKDNKYALWITLFLAFLMIPKEYFSGSIIKAGISILVNPVLIYILAIILIVSRLNEHHRAIKTD